MKTLKLKTALLALAAIGMLSISSCEKGEEYQGTFIYYNEPHEKHCVEGDEIKGDFIYVDPETNKNMYEAITGRIPSEFKPGDTAIVSAETKCVYDASAVIGITHPCNHSLYKFKSVERM